MKLASGLSRFVDAIGVSPENRLRVNLNARVRNRRLIRHARSWKPLLSYAQCAEDAIVQSLMSCEVGQYVDVGAGHPIIGSNTFALYEKGWNGILVDPLNSNIALARKLRPRDIYVLGLCGRSGEVSTLLFEFEVYQYSTCVIERVEELAELGHHPIRSYYVPNVSLESLVTENGLSSAQLLCIDVEGMELDVLKSNSWEVFRPKLIVVEEWQSPIYAPTEVFDFLTGRGYSLAAFNVASSFYLRND